MQVAEAREATGKMVSTADENGAFVAGENGSWITLPGETLITGTTSIAVSGSDVYVGGSGINICGYWKNGSGWTQLCYVPVVFFVARQ